MKRCYACLLTLLLIATAGCGGPAEDRIALSGTVTWAKRPLKWGTIQFESADDPTSRSGGAADIVDGKYQMPRGRGVLAGNFKVRINGGMKAEDNPEIAGPIVDDSVKREFVPPKYNTQSKLTAEVVTGGKTQFDFELP
jgi:hypothetical protein